HQILAMNRGEREEFLKVSVAVERDFPVRLILQTVLKPACPTTQQVQLAAEDSYDRLIAPSLERELRNDLTDKANEGAIHMFALNLKPLLMQPPVKGKVTLGLDPGYRTGCKVAVVDGTGKVLDTAVIYPTHGDRQKAESIATLEKLVHKHHIEHIAIGNGTASKETEMMA
ncbi:MAG: RNA-binding transcriptional accessory protein, partial [Oscillospiraceae bacterium]